MKVTLYNDDENRTWGYEAESISLEGGCLVMYERRIPTALPQISACYKVKDGEYVVWEV